jgi:hypothetical protein
MSYFIVDIDGTIADHLGLRDHFSWELVGIDRPKLDVITVVHALIGAGHKPVFVTGRESICMQDTLDWINQYVYDGEPPHTGWTMHMREIGDYRPDTEVKREIYNAHLKDLDILCVLDDRDAVVRMWRDLGLTCLQVAYGDF